MTSRWPGDIAVADASSKTASPAPGSRPGRRLTAVLLLAAAALDLIRCSLVPMAAPHPASAVGLIAAGLAAAALSVRTACGCQAGRRWSSWAALLIGATSAPQAAVAGFHSPYTIPDTATAVVGVLLSVAVLATAAWTGQAGYYTENSCVITEDHPMSHVASAPVPAHDARAPPQMPGLRWASSTPSGLRPRINAMKLPPTSEILLACRHGRVP